MSLRRRLPIIAVLLAWSVAPILAQPPRDPNLKTTPQLLAALQAVVAKPSEFTARVVNGDKDVALATVVGADGWLVTKLSELKGEPMVVLKDGRKLPAKIVGAHILHDIAMLKVEAKGLPVAEWRDSKEQPVGSWAVSPGVGKEPVAFGVISVAARTSSGPRVLPNPNSGYLGVRMEPLDKEAGVKIAEVMKDTPASKAGLLVNDIVMTIDDITITDVDSMMEVLRSKKVGAKVAVKVKRGDKSLDLVAELGKRPPQPGGLGRGDFQNQMGSTLSERRTGFPNILQHDTVLKPSECGGPLVDLDGKVVGINIARAGRTESYAVPSEVLRPLLVDLQTGKLPPPKPAVSTTRITEAEDALKKGNDGKAALDKTIEEGQKAVDQLKGKK